MTNSQHQAIAAAVAALFTAAPALADGRVYEGRGYPLPVGTASQIQVFLEDSTPEAIEIMGAPVDWTTPVSVLIKARRSANASAEAVADSVWVDVWARVMANQGLGGLVQALDPGAVTRDRDEADTDVAAFTWQFSVRHRTANNVIT